MSMCCFSLSPRSFIGHSLDANESITMCLVHGKNDIIACLHDVVNLYEQRERNIREREREKRQNRGSREREREGGGGREGERELE